jgi:hypothetical protein
MPRGRGRTIGPEDLSGVELLDKMKRDPQLRVDRGRLDSIKEDQYRFHTSVKPATSRVKYKSSIGGSGRDFSGFVDGTPTPDLTTFESIEQRNFDYDEFFFTPLWYEITDARGSCVTVDTRLDVSLNEDGSLKQVVDDSVIIPGGITPVSLDLSEDYDFTGYISLKDVAGDPGAGAGSNGDIVEDQTNSRIWMKVGGSWKSVTFVSIGSAGNLMLMSYDGTPSTTGGCSALTQVETTTNLQNVRFFDFDKDTAEYAEWTVIMPWNWDGGTLTAQFYWFSNSAPATKDVVWAIQGRSYNDNEVVDQAWGTAVVVTDTVTSAGRLLISSATPAITLAGTPAAGELVQFRVYRNAAAAGDTLTNDARLFGIKLAYGVV